MQVSFFIFTFTSHNKHIAVMKTLKIGTDVEFRDRYNWLKGGGIITQIFKDGSFLFKSYDDDLHYSYIDFEHKYQLIFPN